MSDDTLSPDTELELAPEVTLTLSGDRLLAQVEDRRWHGEASLLAVIDAFRKPLTLRDAMARLSTNTQLDWMQLSADILELYRNGILVSDRRAAILPRASGFASPSIHVRMLDDVVRTGTYLEAIREVVKPGDIVIDLGSGTGVLAIAAAQAGAERVYAIERSGIANVAARMFEVNGVADRVTLVREHSTHVELPERADVMVSEIVGNGPFDEQILAYTRDALTRLLKKDARLVPSALSVFAQPVSVPDDLLREHAFDHASAARWNRDYGIDFAGLADTRPRGTLDISVARDKARQMTPLGSATPLMEIDLTEPPQRVDAHATARLDETGRLDGFLVHFETFFCHEKRPHRFIKKASPMKNASYIHKKGIPMHKSEVY